MKRLILCADDFAIHAAASEGIAALARAGRLSATSVMVLSPRWAADAALLQDLRGRIDVGLHLDWTSDFARAAGHGLSLRGAMLRALLGGFDRAAARAVIERQLDAFEAVWQAPPDHIDGHQHVQQFAGIREALVEALQARYPATGGAERRPQLRPYLRLSTGTATDNRFKTRLISGMGAAALARLAGAAGIACAPALSGIYDFDGSAESYAQRMARWLQDAPEAAIVMCHPALHAEAGDEIGPARAWEYAYLASDAFAQALEGAGVALARGTAGGAGRQSAQLHCPA
ncbi:MAG: ChbG/HpnK family deacetylase [Polaromonas sp.]|nr:ChbG/HpnK family deacetylase [Polaromonas sp.]